MEDTTQVRAANRNGASRLAAFSLVAAMALSISLLMQISSSLPTAEHPIQSVAWLFGPAEAAATSAP